MFSGTVGVLILQLVVAVHEMGFVFKTQLLLSRTIVSPSQLIITPVVFIMLLPTVFLRVFWLLLTGWRVSLLRGDEWVVESLWIRMVGVVGSRILL